ncbi:hypothetical protein ES708_28070 [subsurface metagenome]
MMHFTLMLCSLVASESTGQEMIISAPGSGEAVGLTVGLVRLKAISSSGTSPSTVKVPSTVDTGGNGGNVIVSTGIVGPP